MAKQEALDNELVEIEDREVQLGVRKSVVKALIACGTEPPREGGDFEQWSACLYRELRPAEPVAEATAGASEPEGAKVAELSKLASEPEPVAAAEPGPKSAPWPKGVSW